MTLSRLFRLSWQWCLVASLLCTPLSMAWAGGDLPAPPVAAAHQGCHDMPNPAAPRQPHPAAPACSYHCLAAGVVLPVPVWSPIALAPSRGFQDPTLPRVEHAREVDLRPPI